MTGWLRDNGQHVLRGVLLAGSMLAGMVLWFRMDAGKAPEGPQDTIPEAAAPGKLVRKAPARVEATTEANRRPSKKAVAAPQAAPAVMPETARVVPEPEPVVRHPEPPPVPVKKPVVEEVTLAEAEPSPSLEPTETTNKRVIRGIGSFFRPRKEK